MKSGLSYGPSQSSYAQYSSQGAGAKDFQPAAAKYGGASHQPTPAPVGGHSLAQVASQTPLSVRLQLQHVLQL